MFVGLHTALAIKTNIPEIAITADEGKAFMDAAQNVMQHYSVEATQKTLDWIAFVGCAAGIYAPRIVAVAAAKRGRPANRGPAQIVPIRGGMEQSGDMTAGNSPLSEIEIEPQGDAPGF